MQAGGRGSKNKLNATVASPQDTGFASLLEMTQLAPRKKRSGVHAHTLTSTHTDTQTHRTVLASYLSNTLSDFPLFPFHSKRRKICMMYADTVAMLQLTASITVWSSFYRKPTAHIHYTLYATARHVTCIPGCPASRARQHTVHMFKFIALKYRRCL